MGELLQNRFEEWAAEHSSSTALVVPNAADVLDTTQATLVSYAALDAAAEAIAATIIGQIPLPGPPDAALNHSQSGEDLNPFVTVGLCCRGGSFHGVVCMLAALKAGVPYVPLDPASGPDRLDFLLADAHVALVLTEDDVLGDELSDGRLGALMPTVTVDRIAGEYFPDTTHAPSAAACIAAALNFKAARASRELLRNPDDTAYVMYTSGSTGTPKGVLGPHCAMLNRVRWALAAYPFNHGNERKEVACHKTSLSFVDSFFEILGPLGSGVPLVVAPMAARVDPGLLLNLLGKFNVTRLILVPSLLRVLIALADENTADNHGAAAKSGSSLVSMIPLLTHWTISGEALSLDLVEAFFRAHPGAKSLLNLYGSTEVAADVTGIEFQPDRNAGYLMKPTLGVGAENMTLVEAEERPVAPTTIAPIGLPLGGCGVLILDPSSLQEVPPIGVQCFDSNEAQGLSAEAERVGEIIVFGRHLATGYLGRPDLTNAAFVWLRKIPTSQPFVGSESAARCYEQLDPSVAADAEAIAAAKANESNFEDERADPTSPLVVPSDGQLFRCFRTGDFGFLDPAGVLFYVGRRDQMVKIRGQRVDLLEVEAHLRAIPGVETAAVAMLDGGPSSGPIAAAYVVPPAAANGATLRAALAAKVAPYSVPSLFLGVSELPLLASGKLDRAVLKRPLTDPRNPAHNTVQGSLKTITVEEIPFRALDNIADFEQCVATIWQSLGLVGPFTGIPVSENDDTKDTGCLGFFVCGGDSLRLVSLTSRLRAMLRRDVTLLQLAALPEKTVPAMARLLANAPTFNAERAAVAETLPERNPGLLVARYEAYAQPSLEPGRAKWVEAVGPLSYMQQGMLFHCLMHGSYEASMANLEHSAERSGTWTSMYVQQSVFELKGELDLPRFRRAWATLLHRHALLRSFADPDFLLDDGGDLTEDSDVTGGRPVLVTVAASAIALPLKVVDLWETTTSTDGESGRVSQLNDLLESERQRGIGIGGLQAITTESSHKPEELSLLEAPLFRLLLVRVGVASWRLSVVIHHLITDGWSLDHLFQELSKAYATDVSEQTIAGDSYDDGDNGNGDEMNKADVAVPSWQALVAWEMAMNVPGSDILAASEDYWRGLLRQWHPQKPLQYLSSAQGTTPKEVVEVEAQDHSVPHERLQMGSVQVSERLVLDDRLSESVHEVARQYDLTVSALMHGAWALLQSHIQAVERSRDNSGDFINVSQDSSSDMSDEFEDVVVYGCTSSGRSAPVDGIESLVGPVLKTFPVVVNVGRGSTSGGTLGDGTGGSSIDADRPFIDLAASIHMQLFRSMEHEALPLAQMHRLLPKSSTRSSDTGGDTSQLFHTILNFEPGVESVVLEGDPMKRQSALILKSLYSSDSVGYPLTLRAAVSSAEGGNAARISLLMTAEPTGPTESEPTSSHLGSNLAQLLATYVALLQKICEAPLTGSRALRRWLLKHGQIVCPTPTAQLEIPRRLSSQPVEIDDGPSDWFPLTPVQRWFFGLHLVQPSHFNQTILLRNESTESVDVLRLTAALQIVVRRHSALCHRYTRAGPRGSLPEAYEKRTVPSESSLELKVWKGGFTEDEWVQRVAPVEEVLSQIGIVQEFDIGSTGSTHSTVAATVLNIQDSIDIEKGPLLRCALIRAHGEESLKVETIAVVVHHLVMDGVSQRVFIDEFTQAYDALRSRPNCTNSDVAAAAATLAPPPSSFQKWCLYALGTVAPQLRANSRLASWPKVLQFCDLRSNSGEKEETWVQNNTEGAADLLYVNFNVDETDQILAATASSAATSPNSERVGALELFVAALALAFRDTDLPTVPVPLDSTSDRSKPSSFIVDLEGHGRDDWQDLAFQPPAVIPLQTIGWFTAMYPLEVPLPAQAIDLNGQQRDMDTKLLDVVSASVLAFQQLPDRKSLFGLQNIAQNTASESGGRILFNYMGQFGARLPAKESASSAASWRFISDPEVDASWSAPENRRSHDIIFDGKIVDGRLDFAISFCPLNESSDVLKAFAISFKAYVLDVTKAISSKRQFWAHANAALSDPAELPKVPSPLPRNAPRSAVEKACKVVEVWLDETKLDAFVSNMNTACKKLNFDTVLSGLFLEGLRRWINYTPEKKSIAAIVHKDGTKGGVRDSIALIQPLDYSKTISPALYFESVGHQLSFATKTGGTSSLKNHIAMSEKVSAVCISSRAETYFSSHASGHTTAESVASINDTLCSSASAIPVYCLHYAGGSAALFSAPEWASSPTLSIVSVELPGHGSRRGEALLDGVDALAEDVIRSTGLGRSQNMGPFCLLGYSFGALVMLEVAQRLEKMGSPPAHLFVAAEAAPEDVIPAVDPDLNDEDLVRSLAQINHISAEVVSAGPDAWPLLLGPYRADLRAEKYIKNKWDSTLTCPVTAFRASNDETIEDGTDGLGGMMRWNQTTSGEFKLITIEGSHLFINEEISRAELIRHVSNQVESVATNALPTATVSQKHSQQIQLDIDIVKSKLRISIQDREEILPSEVVTGLVETYADLFGALCESLENWTAHPLSELLPQTTPLPSYRQDSVATERLMHGGAVDAAASAPASIAVVNEDMRMTYAQLNTASQNIATHMLRRIQSSNALPRELVIIVLMEKGWRQAVASLACLQAQGAYLPMDPKLPEQRQQHIMQASGASLVLVDSVGLARAPWLRDRMDAVVQLDEVMDGCDEGNESETVLADLVLATGVQLAHPESLAYLIYTSGSTGVPKGVRCHHQGAMNTIQDLNSAFDIGPSDRVLALSSLSFDLSVYDLFGMFEAGATVVIPAADAVSPPDPARWLELLQDEGVTIWNTVPRFMELLVSHVEQSGEKIPASLRLIFMSGDFIPLALPGRIRDACVCAEVRIISMGGATEAAIWSNIFEISSSVAPDPAWSSVPYGQPMRNQHMYVLNEAMEHCAVWVTGVIYIGGLGTALGYQGDAERTAYQFVKHPKTGEYLFRTGDLGRVRPWRTGNNDDSCADLQLEILGREDSQVKVGGYRVELGEIERVLEKIPGVMASCVVVSRVDPARPRLAGFVTVSTPHDSSDSGNDDRRAFAADLKPFLLEKLPTYMVPHAIEVLDTMPLNINGKADRDLLEKFKFSFDDETAVIGKDGTKSVEPHSPAEVALAEVWSSVLGHRIESIGLDANFFDLGGDSISSLRIVAKARASGLRVTVRKIFNNPTVRGLALVAEYIHHTSSGLSSGQKNPGDSDESIFLKSVPEALGEPFPLIGIQKGYWIGIQLNSIDSLSQAPQPIIFNEFEVQSALDVSRLEEAWRCLIRRHDMLRAVLTDAGELKVLPLYSTDAYGTTSTLTDQFAVPTIDLRAADATTIAAQRNDAIAKRLHVNKWPLFECTVVCLRSNHSERVIDEVDAASNVNCLWLVQVKLSLVLLDALSEITLRRELEVLYDDLKVESNDLCREAGSSPNKRELLPSVGVHFRDYAIALTTQLPASEAYKQDEAHWLGRLDTLPDPPELPLLPVAAPASAAIPVATTTDITHNPSQDPFPSVVEASKPPTRATFQHLSGALSCDQWAQLKRVCARNSMTPTACLAAVYAHALAAWQAVPKADGATKRCGPDDCVLINVMHTTRLPLHADIGAVFGNFSSTSLLEACVDQTSPFAYSAAKISQQLASDLEHWRFGGMDVSRALNQRRGRTLTAVAPFVFTSTLGLLADGLKPVGILARQRFTCVTTPQVWIDHQVVEENSTLTYFFDVAEGVFPPEVVTGLVETYAGLLGALCESAENWTSGPLSELLPQPTPLPSYRQDSVATERLIHDGAVHAAASAPASIAVVNEDMRMTYAQLNTTSQNVATHMLRRIQSTYSSPPRELIIIVLMEKGWRQAVASLACLQAQGAYLPMDPKLPEQRQQHIMQASGASLVLVDSVGLARAPWLRDRMDAVVQLDEVMDECDAYDEGSETLLIDLKATSGVPLAHPKSLAYLIYTSGSTGVPKGVRCHHQGAMNTIQDLNSAFDIGPSDRVLALSSLSFDLSVYDLFGMFEAGATVVIPAADAVSPPDPARWLELLQDEGVTVWNTVPRFMELLVSHVEQSGEKIPASLRLIFMSGDFIPLALPGRIRHACVCAEVRIISMGGATEAAIWSNIFEISSSVAPDPAWSSVPYGQPMRNQHMYVLNEAMEHCAVWVTGVIYIGGLGTALGYQGDAERTAYQFVKHPKTGEYLFRTGDLGRVRPWRTGNNDGSCADLQLEILGREDSQVKVGGYRVELGEIERVLEEHTSVHAAVAAVQGSHLVAFVRLRYSVPLDEDHLGTSLEDSTENIDIRGNTDAVKTQGFIEVSASMVEALRVHCSAQLPSYMVPQSISSLEAFPLSANGKVDRSKLPLLQLHANNISNSISGDSSEIGEGNGASLSLPQGPIEVAVQALFAEALRLESSAVAATTPFFSLGGDSLSALFLLRRIAQKFPPGTTGATIMTECDDANHNSTFGAVSVAQLFSGPTVREVADLVLPIQSGVNSGNTDANILDQTKTPTSSSFTRGQLQLIELQRGTQIRSHDGGGSGEGPTRPPLVLIHAAGASGLSYQALVAALDPSVNVYVVDDMSLMGTTPFAFESITEVAATVVALLVDSGLAASSSSASPSSTDLTLPQLQVGGWSYGGVVALEVARMLQGVHPTKLLSDAVSPTTVVQPPTSSFGSVPVEAAVEESSVDQRLPLGQAQVKLIVLFDAPVALEGDVEPPDLTGGAGAAALTSTSGSGDVSPSSKDAWNEEVAASAGAHFAACVALLSKHRTPSRAPLHCLIVSFRPALSEQEPNTVDRQSSTETGTMKDDQEVLSFANTDGRLHSLTTGAWNTIFVSGNHWSLLFPPHTTALARHLQGFLDESAA